MTSRMATDNYSCERDGCVNRTSSMVRVSAITGACLWDDELR